MDALSAGVRLWKASIARQTSAPTAATNQTAPSSVTIRKARCDKAVLKLDSARRARAPSLVETSAPRVQRKPAHLLVKVENGEHLSACHSFQRCKQSFLGGSLHF